MGLAHQLSEKNTTAENLATESSTAMDFAAPFRVLIAPLKTFSQLAQKSTAKGLITIAGLIPALTALAQYTTATKIVLTIDGQPTSFLVANNFIDWFVQTFASSTLSIVMYWLVLAVSLTLISRFFGGRETPLRNSLVILGYLLSVLVVLYAVRAAIYLALPSISFQTSSWPPMDQPAIDNALSLIAESWGPLFIYQFGTYFTFFAFAWLVLLGAIAVKTMREISWTKAGVISIIGFALTLFLFGLP